MKPVSDYRSQRGAGANGECPVPAQKYPAADRNGRGRRGTGTICDWNLDGNCGWHGTATNSGSVQYDVVQPEPSGESVPDLTDVIPVRVGNPGK